MNTNKKTPKLRFKGFTDDWEQRKFGELFILKSGVAFKLSEYTKNGIPIINGESIKAGKISLEKVNYLPNEYQYKYQECLLFPGDIVLGLNRPIIDGELKISRIPSDIKTSLLYQRAGKIIFKVNMEENFTYQLLSKEVLTFTRREAVGSDQPFITTTKLNKWDLCLPVKDEERRMIGNLLDNINNIITLHQRKLEKLKLNKSALLQKLFPQNGCTIPEVRFKGFTDAWEQRKLGEVLRTIPFKPFLKIPEQGGKYEIIQQGNEPIIGYANGEPCEDFRNTVIFGDHTLSLYKPKQSFFVATDGVRILQGTNDMDGYYLLSLLEGNSPQSEGYKRYYSILADREVLFTENHYEQVKIGLYFKNLNNLITLHQRKSFDILT